MRCREHKDLDWLKYIDGQDINREAYEKALGTCQECLGLFTAGLENHMAKLPPGFNEKVMGKVNYAHGNRTLKPWLHYLVAASLTLVFLELGVFDKLPGLSKQLLPHENLPEGAGFISDLLFERARIVFDYLKI